MLERQVFELPASRSCKREKTTTYPADDDAPPLLEAERPFAKDLLIVPGSAS